MMSESSIVPPPNNVPYMWAAILMAIATLVSITIIVIFKPGDNTLLITVLIGFAATTTTGLLTFMKAQETHLSVNSRLDAFMANAREAAHAQGVTEGRSEGRISADQRTDALARKPDA